MPTNPLIIAHRGLRSEYPENTITAIKAALDLPGIAAVEFDVELTDRPLVLHQETMVPDSNFKKLVPAVRDYTSRNWVAQNSAAKIQTLDAGSWFSPKFANLKVPQLKDILELDWKDKIACIELKDPTFLSERDLSLPQRALELIAPDLENFNGRINLLSFNPEIIKLARQTFAHLDFTTTLLLWTEWTERAEAALELAIAVQASSVSVADEMVLKNPKFVSLFKNSGLQVFVYPISPVFNEPEYENWTADSQMPKWQQLVTLGVDGLVTDHAREAVNWSLSNLGT